QIRGDVLVEAKQVAGLLTELGEDIARARADLVRAHSAKLAKQVTFHQRRQRKRRASVPSIGTRSVTGTRSPANSVKSRVTCSSRISAMAVRYAIDPIDSEMASTANAFKPIDSVQAWLVRSTTAISAAAANGILCGFRTSGIGRSRPSRWTCQMPDTSPIIATIATTAATPGNPHRTPMNEPPRVSSAMTRRRLTSVFDDPVTNVAMII